MYQQLKRKFMIKNLCGALLFFVIGIVVILTQFNSIKVMLSPAVRLDELDIEDIRENTKVEAEIDFILDYYAYTEQDGKTIEKEYFIPVGEEEYMGVVLGQKYLEQADANLNATWEYMDGDESALDEITPITVTGTIMPIKGESWTFYREYIDSLGWTDEEEEIFLPYAIMVGDLGENNTGAFFIVLIIGAIVLILGLWLLIRGLTGGALKNIKKYCEATGNSDAAMQRLERFYASTPAVGGVRVSPEFFMVVTGFGVMLEETRNVIWVYEHVVRHSVNLIPTGKTYSLMAMKADGNRMEITMRGKKQAEQTLDYIGHSLPYLFYGYDDQLMAAYNKNRQSMIQAVADRRAQFLGISMPEMQMTEGQQMSQGQNQGF